MSGGFFDALRLKMHTLKTRLFIAPLPSRSFADPSQASPRRFLHDCGSRAAQTPINASSGHNAQIVVARSSRRSVFFGLLSTLSLSQCTAQAVAGLIDEQQADKVFEIANPSVVAIEDYRTSTSSDISEGTGSGFIWDTYGHVVTNYHCIAKLATDKAGSQVCAGAKVLFADCSLDDIVAAYAR